MKYLLILSLSGCSFFEKAKNWIDPPDQPKCESRVNFEHTSGKKILMFGDMFGGKTANTVLKAIKKRGPYDLALYGGDIYGGVNDWDDFREKIEKPLEILPQLRIFFVPGNHIYAEGNPKKLKKYLGRSMDPVDKRIYKYIGCFDYYVKTPEVDIYALDSNEHVFDKKAVERAEKFLCASKKFKLLFMHHPFYSNSEEKPREDEEKLTRKRFMPMVQKCDVDLVFSGHDHHGELIVKSGFYQLVDGRGGRYSRKTKKSDHTQLFVTEKHGFSTVDPLRRRLIMYDKNANLIFQHDLAKF